MTGDFESEQADEYTRLQMNIQRGDGVDRRGDVTVEIKRERRPGSEAGPSLRQIDVPGEDDEIGAVMQDHVFAEFYGEVERAHSLLLDQLRLDEG